jgi:hypothetical protein
MFPDIVFTSKLIQGLEAGTIDPSKRGYFMNLVTTKEQMGVTVQFSRDIVSGINTMLKMSTKIRDTFYLGLTIWGSIEFDSKQSRENALTEVAKLIKLTEVYKRDNIYRFESKSSIKDVIDTVCHSFRQEWLFESDDKLSGIPLTNKANLSGVVKAIPLYEEIIGGNLRIESKLKDKYGIYNAIIHRVN